MELKEVLKEIVSDQCKPIYLVSSEEFFFLENFIQFVDSKILTNEQKEFNQIILNGKETNAVSIADYAMEFPFLGERKLVIVKDAHELKDWDPILKYSKNPMKSTLLIFCFSKKPDGRLVWVKQMKDAGYLHEWKRLSDYQLPAFVKELSKELGIKLDDDAQMMLVEYIGNDLATISNELEKLKMNIENGQTVTRNDIFKNIGISKEYNVFELQKAISQKDHAKIFWISTNMGLNAKSSPIIATIAALFNHFQRIWITKVYQKMNDDELNKILKLPFKNFIKEYREAAANYSLIHIETAIHLLKDYDLKSKGLYNQSATEQDLYVELALKLSHL